MTDIANTTELTTDQRREAAETLSRHAKWANTAFSTFTRWSLLMEHDPVKALRQMQGTLTRINGNNPFLPVVADMVLAECDPERIVVAAASLRDNIREHASGPERAALALAQILHTRGNKLPPKKPTGRRNGAVVGQRTGLYRTPITLRKRGLFNSLPIGHVVNLSGSTERPSPT